MAIFENMRELVLLMVFIPFASFGQKPLKNKLKFNPEINLIKAEAACGICMLDMQGKECELAVKIKDSKYYVIGTGIDDHGDAHSKKGFCSAVKKADIQGKIMDNNFHVTHFELKQ